MKKVISVFFSGTSFSIDESEVYLAASLYKNAIQTESQIKIGFDGCGETHSLRGVIFGTGLDAHCDTVIQRLTTELAQDHEITLNVYGHSRGGVAALMLAQQLSRVDPKKLSINLALLDPVPGNFIATSIMDPLNISLANKVMDLSACKPLKKVLALHPYKSFFGHAPLFPSYPPNIVLEEEIIVGFHSQAEHLSNSDIYKVAASRITNFLIANGTEFSIVPSNSDDQLKALYNHQLNNLKRYNDVITRETHSVRGVYIKAHRSNNAVYLNKHHRQLCNGAENEAIALTLEQDRNFMASLKHAIVSSSFAWQAVKWAFLSIFLASLLVFTQGLALASLTGTFVAGAILGTAVAALWYGLIKPGLLWVSNRFYYPKYAIRDMSAVIKGSPTVLAALGSSMKAAESHDSSIPPYQGKPLLVTGAASSVTPVPSIKELAVTSLS